MSRPPRPARPLVLVAVLLSAALVSAAEPPIVTASGTVMVPMRDGVKLATDVWLPENAGPGPWPVLMARTPYNKNALKPGPGGRGPLVVVAQDCRGRFGSEGRNVAFEPDGWGERRDGYDTCAWLLKQPWCNGKIGTIGGSAVGITQVLLAGAEAPGVVCQSIDVAAGNLYEVCFDGGAWNQNLVEGWLQGAQWDPANLAEWQSHPTYDDYWRVGDAIAVAERTTPAGLFTGGWYDIFSRQTIAIFRARQERGGPGARGNQRLVMGPWGHGRGRRVGELEFPENAAGLPAIFGGLAWERHWLLGEANGVMDTPPVHYYLMGAIGEADAPGNVWLQSPAWPPPTSRPASLYPTRDGSLVRAAPTEPLALTYPYDPANPVPTRGGRNLLLPAGPMDQRPVEQRRDVLVFTSGPLPEPVAVAGDLEVKLRVSTTARDTDFTAKLTDVYPDGRSMLIVDGIQRLRYRASVEREELATPGEEYAITVRLGPTAIVIAAGHRLRLALSSSNAPRFQPNPNTGGPIFGGPPPEVAENTIHAAELVLPILPRRDADA